MKMQIITPEQYFGSIQGDLTRKRAIIQKTEQRGQSRIIDCLVPLAEMFGYATEIRSLSQGRASYTMEPYEYALIPEQISQKVLSSAY